MRIWDISPSKLCRNHLLGEHRELHAMWVVITENKKGYSLHPETLRWKGKLKAMYLRHEELVAEMTKRGYNHRSPLDKRKAIGNAKQNDYVDSIKDQIFILKKKKCSCRV
ncbi:pyrimidine dimer DNA glycosylase/endonuclease V [Nitrosopumilus sp.]|uniref:pyrimidine dimer DNA glycosylase/endonuclease V n=1 Tax=Nitrosopumilus sp. TaxID=2024843 RepID=UPI00292CDC88|nr:pyrimidine dimer DNA glycosylase/endonuclease V [Nitrosopumilus sp.]